MKTNVSVELQGRKVDFLKSEKGDWLRTVVISALEGARTRKIGFKQNSQDWLQAKSALRAAQDILRFGRFDHPETTIGLHFMSEADVQDDGTNLGVISSAYEGELVTPPAVGQYPGEWAQVNRQGTFYLSGFPEQGRFARVRKHNWIDAIQCRGEGVEIGVTPWNNSKTQDMGLADHIMAVMLEPDDAKALQMRYEGFAQAQMIRTIGAQTQQVREDERHGVTRKINTTEPLIVVTTEGELVDLFQEGPCQVRVYDANGHSRLMPWNGTWKSITDFRGVAQAKGYTVELL